MPLGVMLDMGYEEKQAVMEADDGVLLYSGSLVEAHGPQRGMFGFPRLQGLIRTHHVGGLALIGYLLTELKRFTGENWGQEDDITVVMLQRSEVS